MIIVRGTDKFVVRSIHQIPDPANLTGNVVHKFLRSNSRFLSFQLNLLSMLVRSCLEEHIVSLLTFKTRDTVRQHCLISISDMRFAGSIGNRRRNVIFWSDFLHVFLFLS